MGNVMPLLLSLCFIALAGSHKSQKQLEHERLQREAKQEATMKNFREGVTKKFESSKHQMRWTLRDYLDEPSCRSTCTALYRKCGVVKSSDGDRNSVLLGCIARSGMFADTHTAKTTHHQVRTKAKTKSKWSRHDVNKAPSCKKRAKQRSPRSAVFGFVTTRESMAVAVPWESVERKFTNVVGRRQNGEESRYQCGLLLQRQLH